ncbi:MAG: zinc transporter ATP-binding protein ZnuC [Verrucomicrobiota bacterium]|jgi:ABC-type Mn2+/Zn2+ transport system ATPase subunit
MSTHSTCCSPASASPGASSPIISVEDARVVLGGIEVLRGVNLRITPGQVVALIGPNGSGKTTLLRAILGLQRLRTGRIELFGEANLGAVLPRIGYVPQRLDLERSFALSVREFLALRLRQTRHWFWMPRRRVDALLGETLAELGAESLLDHSLAHLSGGQLQRVLIAFSLLHRPELLLLDEPTAGVDAPGEQTFYDLISAVQKRRHMTVVLVSHDLSMVYRHAHRVYALNGVICCEGTPEEVMNAESLKQAFGLHVSPYHQHHHHGLPHAH